jgi:site-specific recombinase XerD
MKNGKERLLPLTEEVGNSLLCYLKEARPRSRCPEVFLTARAPHRALYYSSALSEIVRRYIIKAGIDCRAKGLICSVSVLQPA